MDLKAKPNRVKLPAIFNSQNGRIPKTDPRNYLKASPKLSNSNSKSRSPEANQLNSMRKLSPLQLNDQSPVKQFQTMQEQSELLKPSPAKKSNYGAFTKITELPSAYFGDMAKKRMTNDSLVHSNKANQRYYNHTSKV